MDKEYIYTPAGTNIEERWVKHHGWVRPSEIPEIQNKWKYFQNLPLRNLDDRAKEAYEAVLRKAKVARIK